LTELHALLNEQVNDRYLFGGINANEHRRWSICRGCPTHRLEERASSATATQLATGTIRQVVRVTTDSLGQGQKRHHRQRRRAARFQRPALAAGAGGRDGGRGRAARQRSVQDIDANGFTITSDTPGTAFTLDIAGNDPTPSTAQTVQANVPINASQADVIS